MWLILYISTISIPEDQKETFVSGKKPVCHCDESGVIVMFNEM